ncbi:MAG: selenocysteine-specific translation elongation factor [Firmicutes bacterium]|nr:selenocysteine-specific translation elongation factor [Bacillota bacterium]
MENVLTPLVVGTAGHIDHGKTTLVKALTGQDTDRLPEEKMRGITIDLGFAHMVLPSGRPLAFVDVPGHERFVRNMVAGVHGMDAVMLVVAADEGVMPQTEEHLAILRLLGVSRGLTVITKADLVEPDLIGVVQEMVTEAVRGTFLEAAPVVLVDAVSGRGLAELVATLDAVLKEAMPRDAEGPVRLPIDRVFTVKGFGTVVTGTLVRGQVAPDASLELVPSGHIARVRGVQVHNRPVSRARAGQRVAVNLVGVDRDEVRRGQVLSTPGTLNAVGVAAVALELLGTSPPLQDRARVHVHAGTAEILGRVYFFDREELAPGQSAYAELRLEGELAMERRDRFLLRSYSPVVTIGGGVVVEAGVHHRRNESGLLARLERLHHGDAAAVVKDVLLSAPWPWELSEVARVTQESPHQIEAILRDDKELVRLHDRYAWGRRQLEAWNEQAQAVVSEYVRARPIKPGMPVDELKVQVAPKWPLKVFQAALAEPPWVWDREWVRLTPEAPPWSEAERRDVEQVYDAIRQGGFRPPNFGDIQKALGLSRSRFEDVMEFLVQQGRVHRLEDGVVLADEVYEWGRQKVVEALRSQAALTTAELKDVLGVSRRYAVLFLELLDRHHVTRRVGERRELVP